jgi:hypothetical protein
MKQSLKNRQIMAASAIVSRGPVVRGRFAPIEALIEA